MIGSSNKHLTYIGLGLVICTAVISCELGGRNSGKNSAMSLRELYAYCGIPSACGIDPAWEGTLVTFRGYADRDNIFTKQRYPHLSYEKFKVVDRQGRSIEVWLDVSNSRLAFLDACNNSDLQLVIRGRLAAVNMPIMGKCRLGAKVWIDDPSQIQYYCR